MHLNELPDLNEARHREDFNRLARLAALACSAPSAGISQPRNGRPALRAAIGIDATDFEELPAGHADSLIVPDLAGKAGFGFYAGCAIPDSDATLFVADRIPRPQGLNTDQSEALRLLAGQTSALLAGIAAERDAALYRRAFQAAPFDLVLIDVGPDGSFRYEDTNPAHLANSGFVSERFIGHGPDDVFEPVSAAQARRLYAEVTETGRTLEYERALQFPSGERIRHSSLVPLTDAAGKVAKILLVSIDLTETRRIEAQLRQAQKMEAMGQLTGGIAHDFNNLLTAILGSLELLRRGAADAAAARKIELATRAAERGAQLTQQLLAFARRQRLKPKPVAVGAVLTAMAEMLQRTLGGLVHVQMALADDLWPALADPTQLEQMVLNLAINARDAMPSGGALAITGENATLPPDAAGELPAGEYVLISVADEGGGMTPEVAEKAFEPFFTTKPFGRGSGLGLSQVYGAARQLGGTARIDSKPGQGTTVEILLPRATAAAETPAKHRVPDVGAVWAATVLVVDDDPDVLEVTAKILAAAGYRVHTAGSGADALRILADQPLDLAVLDYAMPGMSGSELAARAREFRPKLPVLFLTGHAHALGGTGFGDARVVAKPFSAAELLAGLAGMLEAPRRPGAPVSPPVFPPA